VTGAAVGGASVAARGLTWRPAGRRTPILDGLDLRIEPGERVLLAGPSGSGKSTLLRALAGLLLAADVGDLSGSVTVDGEPPQARPGTVGLLLQDPAAAVVAERVGRDVAFGLENLAVPRSEMPARVRAALDAVAFPYPVSRATRALSGGELQRLALAGALVLEPRVLLLDEPTAMLDDANAASVREAVVRLCEKRGTTLVVVEHRLEAWLPHVDRCVVLAADGSIAADGPVSAVLAAESAPLAESGVWVPGVAAPQPVPIPPALVRPVDPPRAGTVVVRAAAATVRHRALASRLPGRAKPRPAISAVDATLTAGRALAVTGVSGAGKSTLLLALGGLLRAESGSVETADGRPIAALDSAELARLVAWLPQTPEHGFVATTVLDEALATSRALGLDVEAAEQRGRAALEVLGLSGLERRNPHTLSGGEQRRLLLAASFVHGPQALLLDEPTLGQDRNTWSSVTGLLQAVLEGGAAVGVATHDPELLDVLHSDGAEHLALRRSAA
jgi:energy-coupling factor transport system ATP-binding protein